MISNTIVHLVVACGLFTRVLDASQQQQPLEVGVYNQIKRNTPVKQDSTYCPEKNGRFPVASQCDAYIECIDGVPEQKLCPEGLLFNPEARFNYPCGYPIDIDCGKRTTKQAPQPTEDCPHQYGYFKLGDDVHCGQFLNCVEGKGYVFNCPEGLAFNSESYRCDWPDQVADCDAEAYLGFRCPVVQNDYYNNAIGFYPSSYDCQHYYVCVNGRPRLQNCGEGNAFNHLIDACDSAQNVTGCESPEVSVDERKKPAALRLNIK